MLTLFTSSLLLGIVFCAPPGAIAAEAVRRGFAKGFRPALFVEFGSLVGDATWAIVALVGLAVLVQTRWCVCRWRCSGQYIIDPIY